VKEEAKKFPGMKFVTTVYHKETPMDASAAVTQANNANPTIDCWAMVGGWPLFGAPEENLNWLKACTGKMSDEQLASIVTRFIHEQPDQMPANLNVVTFNAVRDACRKLPN